MPRRRVVAGNWKMHHGPEDTRTFFRNFSLPFEGEGPLVLVFPPSISLLVAVECEDRDPRIEVGAQNVHFEESGAFTGEISATMVAEAGATHVLVGHSERRHVFGETDSDVTRKVAAVVRRGLVPVVCVGETLDEREAGRVEEVILGQLDAALDGLDGGEAPFLVAYEPVWAIGTGETATPADAGSAHGAIRGRLTAGLGKEGAAGVPILYGGSVKPDNAAELLRTPEIDGVLVGGASLDPASFARIIDAVPDV